MLANMKLRRQREAARSGSRNGTRPYLEQSISDSDGSEKVDDEDTSSSENRDSEVESEVSSGESEELIVKNDLKGRETETKDVSTTVGDSEIVSKVSVMEEEKVPSDNVSAVGNDSEVEKDVGEENRSELEEEADESDENSDYSNSRSHSEDEDEDEETCAPVPVSKSANIAALVRSDQNPVVRNQFFLLVLNFVALSDID